MSVAITNSVQKCRNQRVRASRRAEVQTGESTASTLVWAKSLIGQIGCREPELGLGLGHEQKCRNLHVHASRGVRVQTGESAVPELVGAKSLIGRIGCREPELRLGFGYGLFVSIFIRSCFPPPRDIRYKNRLSSFILNVYCFH